LRTPFFFPAISTIKAEHKIYDYFNLLKKTSYPGFLISSYDIYHDEKRELIIQDLNKVTEGIIFTFLDSGKYEAYWRNDTQWTIKKFGTILKEVNVDLCFSFDIFWEGGNVEKHIKKTITYSAMTAGMQKLGNTIPIIHTNSEDFIKIIRGVVEGINPQIIGIVERELGASLFERAKAIKKIRDELDKIGRDIPIHLLGTGNPISMLIYTLCGADLFDSFDWYNSVVNPKNGLLYHFIQKELVECNCRACKMKNIPYNLQTMAHNLIFYEQFTDEIRKSIDEKQTFQLIQKYLPEHTHQIIKRILD